MNQTTFERRITTQLTTWLRAVGIGFEATTSGLVVTNQRGEPVPVDLGEEKRPNSISVHGPDLTNRDLAKSLKAFSALQVALGYEPRVPVDRGPIPTRKAHYADDFDLVAMRHSELRRVPNPPAAKLKAYEVVIGKASWKFYRWNQQACQDHGLEIDDLKSFASMWTVNYIGMYEMEGIPQSENEKYLFKYLSQRFQEFRKQLDKKSRNTLTMLDEAFIATHGRPYEYTTKGTWYSEDVVEEDVDPWEEEPEKEEEPTRTEGARGRRKRRTATLKGLLAELPHDEMVQKLVDVVDNDRVHLDARRTASKYLQAHAKKCAACFERELPRVQGDDSAPGNVPIRDENGVVYPNIKAAAKALKVFPSNVRKVLCGTYAHTGGHTFEYVSPAQVQDQAAGADSASVVE